jgi:Na+-translocating ferredoxin:NAD+ oxidoreductase RNF subunit RnfB
MAILVLGSLAFLFGILLVVAGKLFAVKEDPKKNMIAELLAGVNCGACGFSSCQEYAGALVSQKTALDRCAITNTKAKKHINEILGIEVDQNQQVERLLALVYCAGGKDCLDKYTYHGVATCEAADLVFKGQKACNYGCLGFGDCVRVCPFDAITISSNGLPVIDENLCTGCGICVQTCPKKVIGLIPRKNQVVILCNSIDKGGFKRKICKVGCIGCGLCKKACPEGAIEVNNNLAKIDYSKCTNCGKCIEVCPVNTIIKRRVK